MNSPIEIVSVFVAAFVAFNMEHKKPIDRLLEVLEQFWGIRKPQGFYYSIVMNSLK